MSFFDEADEPRPAPRRAPRRRRPAGGGRRPPTLEQAIRVRRAVAAVVILVLLILIVLGVHSCQISARNSALKDYNNSVGSLIQQSDATSQSLFTALSGGSSNVTGLQNSINGALASARTELSKAKGLSVPSEMGRAEQDFVLALQMRADGIGDIAANIQQALGTTNAKAAVDSIAADMARFYASDVVFTDYATHEIAAALHGAGIGVGGTNGVSIQSGQFLPDLSWLVPAVVAGNIGAKSSATGGKFTPGLHGHSLNSVSVGGTTLQTGSTNTIARAPAPTFTFNFSNGGRFTETNVTLKVTLSGSSISGTTIVPQTSPGQTLNSQVTLNSSPPAGNYTVTCTIEPVPGEKNTANNTLTFPVTFQ